MKNNKRHLMSNFPDIPAAPASVWGKGVPGKGGATLNYDETLNDRDVKKIIHRGKGKAANA